MQSQPNPPLNFFSTSFETSSGPPVSPPHYGNLGGDSPSVLGNDTNSRGAAAGGWKERVCTRWNDRNFRSKALCCCCAMILFVIAIILATSWDRDRGYDVSLSAVCLDPVNGGGEVGSMGQFPRVGSTSEDCMEEMANYFDSNNEDDYYEQVSNVANSARAYIQTKAQAVSAGSDALSRQVVIFGIDETALSNIDYFGLPKQGRPQWNGYYYWDARRRLVSMPQEEQGTTFGDGHLNPSSARSLITVSAALPAIAPVLQLYKDAYRMGYAVVFVTGREESYRSTTVTNLLTQGYGSACVANTIVNPAPPPSVTNTSGPGVAPPPGGTGDGSGGGRRSARSLLQQGPPCYQALLMRPTGDTRLASIVKPELRGQLTERQLSIVLSIGDQYSDLTGDNTALAYYKLPNPMYFTL